LTVLISIDISGKASTATYASDSDKLDGYDSSHFATVGHTHSYVSIGGDTMTGKLTAPQFQGNIFIPDTRNNAINPGDLKSEARIDFKYASVLGVPSPKGAYYTNITMRPWSDDTGGPAHQIALGGSGDIRYRTGTQSSGWSSWNKVWHAGNDGSGSGLDADLLDGKHASAFALAHDHPYVKKAGDTMTGTLTAPEYQINDANTKIGEGSNNSVRIQTNYGYVDIGPQNTGWAHFNTDRPEFYFNKPVEATNMLKIYNTDTWFTGSEGKIAGNTVWHAGNDGSGSGLDADLLDGKHASSFIGQPVRIPAGQNLNNYKTPGMYYSPANVDAQKIANTPVNYAFSLLVEKHAGVKQTFTEYVTNNPRTWYRNYYNGTWGPWIKAASGSIVAQSLGDRGYVQFDNGFIINWGTVGARGSWATFAKTFPHRCFVVVTGQFTRDSTNWDPGRAMAATAVTNSGFRQTASDPGAYIALGY